MAFGAYDEGEHERRDQLTSQADAEFEERPQQFSGTVSYDAGDSTEELLNQFHEIQED
ncbi:DUF5786 family protein [Halolamina salifodinae]|uniref:DUF5786 domain-containing protein n=1 Tax=Halolamina salifodinae TaxID=1202767 RepID=A0A8T4H570_9EURY|nr:DUF5786 family protein [Halolamina salifodinae]MBP1988268.1 hypothetical protein [Halolamina salifodinae]